MTTVLSVLDEGVVFEGLIKVVPDGSVVQVLQSVQLPDW